MKYKISKMISAMTIVPLIALCALTAVYLHDRGIFGGSLWYIASVFLLLPVYWARVNMGRHTFGELIYGNIAGMAATTLAVLI
ncbi:MAG: hypothetical protein ACM3TR_14000 [Caulobacteraceae bacterium]